MRYMGGKVRIANDIASILNAFTWGGQHRPFVSLFCGGCAIESKVKADLKICNDIHPYLIAMWRALQEGWIPPDAISREEYYQIKANPDVDPPLTGFVGFGCSFGGKWWGGYAKDKRGDDYCGQAKRGVLKDLEGLRDTMFLRMDYRQVAIPVGAVVYCDCPYHNTTTYSTKFDSVGFWDYMRWLNDCGHLVFVSEQSCPADFIPIWSKQKIRTLKADDNKDMVRTEYLFVHKDSYKVHKEIFENLLTRSK